MSEADGSQLLHNLVTAQDELHKQRNSANALKERLQETRADLARANEASEQLRRGKSHLSEEVERQKSQLADLESQLASSGDERLAAISRLTQQRDGLENELNAQRQLESEMLQQLKMLESRRAEMFATTRELRAAREASENRADRLRRVWG